MKHFHSHCDIFLPYIIYSDYSCFSCFFVLLCVLIWLCMYGGTWRPPKPLTFHWMLVSSLLVNHFPTHMLVTIKHCLIIYGSFYLVFRLACVCASPYTHPKTHPHAPESLLALLCPFTHICLFWEISPVIKGPKSYPVEPFFLWMVSLFVLFSYVLVLLHPTAPIYTHPHPSAPAHTLYYIENMRK